MRAICGFVREQRPRSFPAVLVGDLNAVPNSDELRMLTGRAAVPVPGVWFRDAWKAAGNADPGRTVSNANPFIASNLDLERRIDYVLVAAPKAAGCGHVLAAEVVGDRPIDGMWGSDHYGVAVDLRY